MTPQKRVPPTVLPSLQDAGSRDYTRVVVHSSKIWERKGLPRCFSPRHGFVLVQQNGTFQSVLSDCEKMAPCVLIVDQVLMEGEPSGLEDLGARVEFGRSIQVLVVGPARTHGVVESLLRVGCVGFVTYDVSLPALRKAVRAVAAGELWADRQSTGRVVQQLLLQSGSRTLTPRETQILRLIGLGYKNRAIADRLYITRDTVRWHIRGIYAKIGVQDRLAAALYARENLGEESKALSQAGEAVPEFARKALSHAHG